MTFQLSKVIGASALAIILGAASGQVLAESGRTTGELPIAVQMWTMRNAGNIDAQLAYIEAAGITAIETFGRAGDLSAKDYKKKLDAHGIEVISHHEGIDSLRSDVDAVIDYVKGIGGDTVIMPYLADGARPTTAAGWQALGIELAGFAEVFAENDMTFGYHNHNFEMVEYNGKTAIEIIAEAGGPDVKIELDLAWAQRGGQDPAALVEKLSGQLFAVHAKDNATAGGTGSGSFGFISVGNGTIDWSEVLPAADSAGVEWYIIEQDDPNSPDDAGASIARSATFLTDHIAVGSSR